jgi:hypothetical protein
MSAWFNDGAPPLLVEEAVRIAINFLDRTGEIDDLGEACQFLVNKVGFMIEHGQRNRLLPTALSLHTNNTGSIEPSNYCWFPE